MIKFTDILSELLNEDRCKRIADRKYDKPSAYKSGAIVRCRDGKIWKDIKEDITTSDKPVEDSFLTKALNSLSGFIRGKELNDFLNKIKTVATFDDYILKFSKGTEGANQFMIEILNKEDNDIIGKFVAFIYKDKETQKYSLQIQKVEIYPKYKGKGIMRKFYQEFNKWLKDNFDNFDKFTSDFIFLYNKDTGKYDGFSMWEDLVKKGLAKRLGPDQNYIPPTTPPKDGMWRIETGYALNENDDKIWKGLKEDWQDTSWTGEKGQKVTLKQLLDIIKDYPIIQAPIEKVEKIIIKKDTGGIESDRLSAADIKHPIIIVVDDNNNYKYVLDGNHRANKAIDTGLKSIPAKLVNISKLPDEFQSVLAEKQKESLHKWFKRQGAPGKSGGWVDCNTCRTVDGKKKCKACGRQKGEKRSKYPSCRPTPSQCSRPGKGKTWGKTNEAEINTEKIFSFEYTGTRKNTIDNTGGLLHTYTFDTDNNEYTVYFYDDKDGTYERVFGTVQRNLAPTQEDIPFKIYRTVTAITLDFLDRVSGDKNFKQLEIEPISDQRGIVVKKFVNDYIAPKYDVEQVGKNIIIRKRGAEDTIKLSEFIPNEANKQFIRFGNEERELTTIPSLMPDDVAAMQSR